MPGNPEKQIPISSKKLLISIMILLAGVFSIWWINHMGLPPLRISRTYDAVGRIEVALCWTYGPDNTQGYDFEKSTISKFPSIRVTNDKIIDGWGTPIKCTIIENAQGYKFTICSAGPDRIFGTKDDLVDEGQATWADIIKFRNEK